MKMRRELAKDLPLMPGAKELCTALKRAGWKMIAVSGGFTIITDRLKEDLGIDRIFSNELVFKDGKLEDVIMNVTSDKAAAVRSNYKRMGDQKGRHCSGGGRRKRPEAVCTCGIHGRVLPC